MKSFLFIFTWTTFLILFEPYHDVTESLNHNDFRNGCQTENVGISLQPHSRSKKLKRHTESVFMPLRINTIYSLDNRLLVQEQENLKRVLERAVTKITHILSVRRLTDPLLMLREPCPIIIRSGINKGKCARIKKGYSGEVCLDGFKIPSAHLKGYAVYNKTHLNPVRVYFDDGPGLIGTDFVLYVTSRATALCNPYKSSALAYAASCKTDHDGRPIAGQVNFCPRTLKAQKFEEELMYKTAVHELFHALGFSSKLFDKFKKCDEDGQCQPWPQPMYRPENGVMRLLTDAVMRETKRHFNCTSKQDFGGPLEVVNGRVTSHWNSLLMHSSIMTAKEQKPFLTLIDPITLAVFEDSGWYKVNYSHADNFVWGRGQGCSFGLWESCQTQEGFCTQNITGCHHMRLTKARCNANNSSTAASCGVFAADQMPCFADVPNRPQVDEVFSLSSRCFWSTLTPTVHSPNTTTSLPILTSHGRCYERKCDGEEYHVRVYGGEWIQCHSGSSVQVAGYEGHIHCPDFGEVCSDFIVQEPHPDDPITTTVPSTNIRTNLSDHTTQTILHLTVMAAICLTSRKTFSESGCQIVPYLREGNFLGNSWMITHSVENTDRLCLSVQVMDKELEADTDLMIANFTKDVSALLGRDCLASIYVNITAGRYCWCPLGENGVSNGCSGLTSLTIAIGFLTSIVEHLLA